MQQERWCTCIVQRLAGKLYTEQGAAVIASGQACSTSHSLTRGHAREQDGLVDQLGCLQHGIASRVGNRQPCKSLTSWSFVHQEPL